MSQSLKNLSKSSDLSHQSGVWVMLVIFLVLFLLGANGLNTDVIWADELTSVGHMGTFDPPYSPSQIIGSIAEKSPQHMPLFFLIGAGWSQLLGWSHFALRLISLFAGVLLIAWVYRFATDVINRRSGLVASLLMGTSAFMIVYLHEIRMYSLFMMLAVMHAWLYWRLAHSLSCNSVTAAFFILTTSALFYTHIFSTVLFAGLGIYHLVFVSKTRRWIMIILGWGLGTLLFLPYVPTVINGFNLATNKVSTFTTALSTPELIETFIYLLTNGLSVLLIVFGSCLIYGLWEVRSGNVLRFLFIALVMFLTLILINQRFGLVPLRRARYLLILWFPFLILFAFGLTALSRWQWVTPLVLGIWLISGWQLYRSPTFPDHIGTIAVVQHYPPLHDYVVALDGKVRAEDYVLGFTEANFVNNEGKHDKSVADYYMEAQLGIDGAFIPIGLNDENLQKDVPEKIDNHPYFLFTYNRQEKPDIFDDTLDLIQENYQPCDIVLDTQSLFAQRYVSHELSCEREYAPIAYENDIKIVDKFAEYDSVDEVVRITTGWEVAEEAQLFEYNVSLQIVTGNWQNMAQTDRHLHDDLLKWYVAELSVEDLPPNDYRVMVVLYHQGTGEKVMGIDLTTDETGTILPITVFTIEE